MKFWPYLKLQLKMIEVDLVVLGCLGALFFLSIYTIIGIIFFPFIVIGIAYYGSRPMKKLKEDSLFGTSSGLYMSLPVDVRTVVAGKLIACMILDTMIIAACLLPLVISGFGGLFQLDRVYEAMNAGGNGPLLAAIAILNLILLMPAMEAAELTRLLRYRSQPVSKQTKGRDFVFRIAGSVPFLAIIFWNGSRDRDKTPVLDWLAEGSVLPLLLAVLAIELVFTVISVKSAVKFLETRYQKV